MAAPTSKPGKTKQLTPSAAWYRIEGSERDWKGEAKEDLIRWYWQMLLIRRFEERLLELSKSGLIHGPAHASIGQEAGAVGAMSILMPEDKINGTHRAHHQVLMKLLAAVTPQGLDLLADDFTGDMDDVLYRFMAEIMGLEPGYCGGRGGSMHMRDEASGIGGTSAIVGGNPPHAVGYALADKMLKRDRISIAFFGDGAAQNGATYEAMNIAAVQSVPTIFFIENNLYGVSTHLSDITRETRLSSRGAMFGIPSIEVDAMDVVAVHKAMVEARRIIREDGGPVVIEALCYRHFHQYGDMPGSAFGYRSEEEEAEWRSRDPIATAEARLKKLGVLDAAQLQHLDELLSARVKAAAERLTEPDPGGNALRIPQHLWPDPGSKDEGIVGDLSELRGKRFLTRDDMLNGAVEQKRFVVAASETLASAMQRDPRIIVLGEDVHRLSGGVSGMTRDALTNWPERVLPMPIAENGFSGVAMGAALNGLRPVVEIMFGDFCFTAADQIANAIAKVRHMFGSGFPVPLVMRVRISPQTGYGSQHSSDPSAFFNLLPGWRIFSPSNGFDYIGMMNAALTCDDPVVIIEHTDFYQRKYDVPKGDRDYLIPFGQARIVRPGTACTVLAYGVAVEHAQKAAEETGIDAEIIDLRNIDVHGLDWDLIGASIEKTGRVVTAEQTARSLSLAPSWVAEIQDRFFDYLDHEIIRVTGGRAAPTVSAVLNRAALAQVSDVSDALVRIAGKTKIVA
ncbi:thiamine pyrophosphate-dependent enzyme [Ruegeria sp. 2012CJ41-6]|uniref:2-oxoglutarate dehydrogenase E1 component n=1 Tax=Ruegeria spongiae TaxID=2942209 RepID=A0ABT0Q2T0_9RHOB|nr:alpha-ketoacid dehydrogenase subunit alpha/beta [Ruegeria spongiae]MCL6284183.1 thiamine pyrophosphate-dependent enzyme [Ruegeria spongiae]